jgi:tRNA A37 methylthiotransferase MiaB
VADERWQRLIEAQTRAAEKKAKARLGAEIDVLVETDLEGGLAARAAHQAPEVDGGVLLDGPPKTHGFYRAKATGMRGVHLTADLLP